MAKGVFSPSRTGALVNGPRLLRANDYSAGGSHNAYSLPCYFIILERTWDGGGITAPIKGRYIAIGLHNKEERTFWDVFNPVPDFTILCHILAFSGQVVRKKYCFILASW